MITAICAPSSNEMLSSLTRITNEELDGFRRGLPSGTTELVDCDADTFLFLNPSFRSSSLVSYPIDSSLEESLKFKDGLIPVVTVDAKNQILMQAFSNLESLRMTLKNKRGTYFSRSRNSLWLKGDTSGHIQNVLEILVSEDKTFLVYRVEQVGAACHEGYYSCFFREKTGNGEYKTLSIPFFGKENTKNTL
ncbi:phosphoribosyl-AMP cyclohydrolase [Leptospira perolatii]|uniref:phosphoribosyl-AMP cyclohydrolase n=1 Tax=Leptospira perolatii TaxID=2023191 RepID=A0A2M9ZS63_9LEPT|nr:phosphoribosyl-AMP cyclohydrolase [Leptospira perolatii]PJZ71403.1 phosphoribosyl-AMP cyclohydrolase [Leptospira perolatii]PJZ74937.1 phosphoribosyl-AMP cyclohydrolase [Leptospira perolatii]